MMRWIGRAVKTVALALGVACSAERSDKRAAPGAPLAQVTQGTSPPPGVRVEPPSARDAACAAARARLAALPPLTGAPGLEARRTELFLRAKADGVIFRRAPEVGRPSGEGARIRGSIASAEDPVRALFGAYPFLQ